MTTVGNAAERVVRNVQHQVEQLTHTCFMVTPSEGYVDVCEALAELTPVTMPSEAPCSTRVRGRGERRQDRPRGHRSSGSDRLRARLPRTHEPTMALTAKNMPYKQGFGPFAGEVYRAPMAYPLRWPGGPDACADEAFLALERTVHTQVGETERGGGDRGADPGGGRFRRASPRMVVAGSPSTAVGTGSC